MTTIHDLGWWYWFMTVGLLVANLFDWPAGIYVAKHSSETRKLISFCVSSFPRVIGTEFPRNNYERDATDLVSQSRWIARTTKNATPEGSQIQRASLAKT